MKNSLSIGLRLTLSYLLIFAIAQLIFGLGMWFILRHNLYDISDDTLEGQIDDLRHIIEAQGKGASTSSLQEEVTDTYALAHSGDYLQIQDEQNDWIYRSPFLEKHSLPALNAGQLHSPSCESRRIGNQSFRFLSQNIEVYGRSFFVRTGVPEDDIITTLGLFRRYLLTFCSSSAPGSFSSRLMAEPESARTRRCAHENGTQHLWNESQQPVGAAEHRRRIAAIVRHFERNARLDRDCVPPGLTVYGGRFPQIAYSHLPHSHRGGNCFAKIARRSGISGSASAHSARGGKDIVAH